MIRVRVKNPGKNNMIRELHVNPVRFIIMLVWVFLSFILSIWLVIKRGIPLLSHDSYRLIGVFICGGCVYYQVIWLRSMKRTVSALIKPVSEAEYIFDADELVLYGTSEGNRTKVQYTYDGLNRAYETDKYFYIYIDKKAAYMLCKTEITEGTPDELRSLLYEKLGDRFMIR